MKSLVAPVVLITDYQGRLAVPHQQWILTAVVLGGLLFSLPAAARHDSPSLDSVVSKLRERTGGHVLSAETKNQGDAPVHHIRIITERGKVKRYRVDVRSGRLLSRPKRR